MVKKTLRSLHESFAYKITAIEEARDLNTMTLKELMCSLQTFELNLKMNKKENSIAFQAQQHNSFDKGNMSDDESVILLTKNFNKYFKRMNKKKKLQGLRKVSNF